VKTSCSSTPTGFTAGLFSVLMCASLLSSPLDNVHSSDGDISADVEQVAPAVIAISIDLKGIATPAAEQRYGKGPVSHVIVGTGFLINRDGVGVTALHVITGILGEVNIARALGVTVSVWASVPLKNGISEPAHCDVRANFSNYKIILLAVDEPNDIAVFKVDPNPFVTPVTPLIRVGNESISIKPGTVQLDRSRPSDGVKVFTTGYPLNNRTLVTTSGVMSSVWSQRQSSVNDMTTHDRYLADIRISKGNSGGPVVLAAHTSVVGLISRFDYGPDITRPPDGISAGSVQVIPASFICKLLDANHISWNSPTPKPSKQNLSQGHKHLLFGPVIQLASRWLVNQR
jgi:S1-C subfamily serine protease